MQGTADQLWFMHGIAGSICTHGPEGFPHSPHTCSNKEDAALVQIPITCNGEPGDFHMDVCKVECSCPSCSSDEAPAVFWSRMGSAGFQKHSGLAMNGSWRQTFLVDVPGIACPPLPWRQNCNKIEQDHHQVPRKLFRQESAYWLGPALLQSAFLKQEAITQAAN